MTHTSSLTTSAACALAAAACLAPASAATQKEARQALLAANYITSKFESAVEDETAALALPVTLAGHFLTMTFGVDQTIGSMNAAQKKELEAIYLRLYTAIGEIEEKEYHHSPAMEALCEYVNNYPDADTEEKEREQGVWLWMIYSYVGPEAAVMLDAMEDKESADDLSELLEEHLEQAALVYDEANSLVSYDLIMKTDVKKDLLEGKKALKKAVRRAREKDYFGSAKLKKLAAKELAKVK